MVIDLKNKDFDDKGKYFRITVLVSIKIFLRVKFSYMHKFIFIFSQKKGANSKD